MVIPCGFKSHSSHQQADVAELADALDSGSSGFTAVQVQVLSSAPEQTEIEPDIHFCKRCCGFYLCKVRKKHKVKCLVLFAMLPPKRTHPDSRAKTDIRRRPLSL